MMLHVMAKCEVCGGKIPAQRLANAKNRNGEPTPYDSKACANKARVARFRAKKATDAK